MGIRTFRWLEAASLSSSIRGGAQVRLVSPRIQCVPGPVAGNPPEVGGAATRIAAQTESNVGYAIELRDTVTKPGALCTYAPTHRKHKRSVHWDGNGPTVGAASKCWKIKRAWSHGFQSGRRGLRSALCERSVSRPFAPNGYPRDSAQFRTRNGGACPNGEPSRVMTWFP